MNYIIWSTFNFTKFSPISLNFFNIFLCGINSFKLNIIILIIFFYCLYYNNFMWKFTIVVILIYIFIVVKLNFILNNFYLGYYKIHPLLLYLSLGTVLTYLNKKKNFINWYYFLICVAIFLTFLLGSLWSLSQSIWGRYWSNDSIEIVLIIFFIVAITYLHLLFKIKKIYDLFFIAQLVLLLILLRLNFIYTKHNFFQKKLNYEIFFYLLYNFSTSLVYNIYLKKKIIKKNNIKKIIFYLLIIELVVNLINVNFFKILNIWFFFFFICYVFLFLNLSLNFFIIHVIVLTGLIIFNNYYNNFLKYNFLYIYKKKLNTVYYFIYQKNLNYYIYYKNIFFNKIYNFYNIYTNLKQNSLYLKKNLIHIYLINFL